MGMPASPNIKAQHWYCKKATISLDFKWEPATGVDVKHQNKFATLKVKLLNKYDKSIKLSLQEKESSTVLLKKEKKKEKI